MPALVLILAMLLQQAATQPVEPDAPDPTVDQVDKDAHASVPDLSVQNVGARPGTNPAMVQQLPPTLEAPAGQSTDERALIPAEDKKTLVGEVARASEMLRQRGQQPTPEALAREIGPDALATFLNQDPSALDSYAVPKEDPGVAPILPDGGEGAVVILPPVPQH